MQTIIIKWFYWQFLEVPKNVLKAWKNFLKFGWNYFSVSLLVKTFFSPWRRYYWAYPRSFDLWKYFETFSSNVISRTLGSILRFFLIIVGVLLEIFILIFGFVIFLGWLILPIFLIFTLYHGFRILF